MLAEANASRARVPRNANSIPSAPPIAAVSMLSVSDLPRSGASRAAPSASRTPDCSAAIGALPTHQQQVRDIGACNQQHEPNHSHQDQERIGKAFIAQSGCAPCTRLRKDSFEMQFAHMPILPGFVTQRHVDGRLRLTPGNARFQAAHRLQPEACVAGASE